MAEVALSAPTRTSSIENRDITVLFSRYSLVMLINFSRHDGLRLRADDEMPRQWLDESLEPPLTVEQLSFNGDPDVAFLAHVEEVFATPMSFGNRPLFHIELIRAGDRLSYLLWRFHH